MIRKLCDNFINYICEDNFNSDEKEVMTYVLKVIVFEILKLVGTLIIFYLLGYFYESLIILIIFSFVKPFIGGYHAASQLNCFLANIFIHSSIIILSQECTITFIGTSILVSAGFLAIYNQAPIINDQMPMTKPKLIKKNRKRGLINLSIISLISIIIYIYDSHYSAIICWSIVSLAILMFNRLSWQESLDKKDSR